MNKQVLNRKFILINTMSTILVILGVRQLFILLNPRILEASFLYGTRMDKYAEYILQDSEEMLSGTLLYYKLGLALAGLLGLLITILLSLWETRQKDIPKVNVLFIALLGFAFLALIGKAHFDFHQLIPFLRNVVASIGVKGVALLNAILLITAGLFLHYSKRLKNQIYQQSA